MLPVRRLGVGLLQQAIVKGISWLSVLIRNLLVLVIVECFLSRQCDTAVCRTYFILVVVLMLARIKYVHQNLAACHIPNDNPLRTCGRVLSATSGGRETEIGRAHV